MNKETRLELIDKMQALIEEYHGDDAAFLVFINDKKREADFIHTNLKTRLNAIGMGATILERAAEQFKEEQLNELKNLRDRNIHKS